MEAYRRPRTEAFERPRANLFERAGFGRLDPLLLFAGVALIAFSIYTLGVATSEDVPGNPYFYVVRQSIYAVVGIALMFAVVADRLLALPRAPGRDLHGDDRLDPARASCSPRRPADRTAGSSCRSSPSSPRSWARCCWS